jgi:hypothetical protein
MPDRVMNFIEADIPVDVSLAQWRRSRGVRRPRRRFGLTTFMPARAPRTALGTA